MMQTIRHYLELIRFSHTVFALPFAAAAAVLAWHTPLPGGGFVAMRWTDVAGVLLCMVTARSAAMAINRLWDRDIDAANPRTSGRHLPAGLVSRGGVEGFIAVTSVAFVLSTALFLPNWIPLAFSVPVLAWLFGYTLAKRFTAAAHVWLGVALALSPVCTWVAIRGVAAAAVPSDYAIPLTLAAIVATWVAGFDVLYACQDAAFDREAKLHSVPAKLGVPGALRFSAICHAVMLPIVGWLGWVGSAAGLGWVYAVSAVVVSGLVVYQHRLVRPDDLSRVGAAFFQTNAVISVLLLVAVTIDCIW